MGSPAAGRINLSESTLEVFLRVLAANAGLLPSDTLQQFKQVQAAAVQAHPQLAAVVGDSSSLEAFAPDIGAWVLGQCTAGEGQRRPWPASVAPIASCKQQPLVECAPPCLTHAMLHLPLTPPHPRCRLPAPQRRRPTPTSSACTPETSRWTAWWRWVGGGGPRRCCSGGGGPAWLVSWAVWLAPRWCACCQPPAACTLVHLALRRPPPQVLKGFKNSTLGREQEVFACMVHNLFDEYRFFPKYPDKELATTGEGRLQLGAAGSRAEGLGRHMEGAGRVVGVSSRPESFRCPCAQCAPTQL